MQVTVEGKELVIRIPLDVTGTPSASGKTQVHASTHGNMTTSTLVNGKPLTIGLNAYTRR